MNTEIEKLCKEKEQQLLNEYFGNLIIDAAIKKPEDIDEYTIDLPLKVEAEFRAYLEELWKQYSTEPLVFGKQMLRKFLIQDDLELINEAYKDANRITLLERITNSNHKDVTYYKALLQEYTKDLLTAMRHDFLKKITDIHINCKSFEDD
ncbi:MAG: hypothetical protein NC098_00730 [Lachnoclostridium sp.]|nr:hypothetical protein [Lachnoclostridium sp.]